MKIKTYKDLLEFSSKLQMANVEIPTNVEIVVDLEEKSFKEIVPEEFWTIGIDEVEYNACFGIPFKLKTNLL